MQFSGPEAILLVLFVSLPFIIFTVFNISVLAMTFRSLGRSLSSNGNSTQVSLWRRSLAILSLALLVAGAGLLIHFGVVGGPNEGLGKHLFGNNDNPYADMQLGMAAICIGVLLSTLVHYLAEPQKRAKALKLCIAVAVILTAVGAYTYAHTTDRNRRLAQYEIQKQQRIDALPPVLVPSWWQEIPEDPDAKAPPLNKPMLGTRTNDPQGFTVSGYDRKSVHVIGAYTANTKKVFAPATKLCDIEGIKTSEPSPPAELQPCDENLPVNGGTLYMSNRTTLTGRNVGAFVKGDAVYRIAAGESRQELIDTVSQLHEIPKDKLRLYISLP